MNHQADICVWNMAERKLVHRLSLHKTAVAALAFSPSGQFLVSLGGPDDGRVTVWDLVAGKAVADAPAASRSGGNAGTVTFSQTSDTMFVTGGDNCLRLWTLDATGGKLAVTDCVLGSLKRHFTRLAFSPTDEQLYAATTTGDIVLVAGMRANNPLMKSCGPEKQKFVMGIRALTVLKTGDVLVGGGDGTVALTKPAQGFRQERVTKVEGAVTSIALRGEGHELYVATSLGTVARIGLADFATQVRSTAHHGRINDLAFPEGTSALMASCSSHGIRVWATATRREVLRIPLHNKDCLRVVFLPNGKLILSGWDDGTIRAFLPESGKLKFEIGNAHNNGVTALAVTPDNRCVVSGGGDGKLRIWDISSSTQVLVATTSQHKGAITEICISKDRAECLTASVDGSCILWDLSKYIQKKVILAATQFMAVQYRPDEAQILTAGSDRKLGYWETFDGSLIREVEVAACGAINSLDIAPDGRLVALGGGDRILKLYTYNECERALVAPDHCGDIMRVKIAPDQVSYESYFLRRSLFWSCVLVCGSLLFCFLRVTLTSA